MLKNQKNINEFMDMAGQNLPKSPTVSDENTRKLRIRLTLEELVELAEASGYSIVIDGKEILKNLNNISLVPNGKEPDIIGMADAITDIDYVNTGAASAFGLNLEKCHDEVHASNMSKLWTIHDIMQEFDNDNYVLSSNDSQCKYTNTSTGEEYVVKILRGGKSDEKIYGIFLNNKLKKSPTYTPADLGKIINI